MNDIRIKQTFFEGNTEIGLWEDGLINITTCIFLLKERAKLEILEQIHPPCPFKKCKFRNDCMNHCPNNEIISYIRRDIWVNE